MAICALDQMQTLNLLRYALVCKTRPSDILCSDKNQEANEDDGLVKKSTNLGDQMLQK